MFTDIDDCKGINCNNGECIDGVASYSCECDEGWNGVFCDHSKYN